MIKNKIRIGGSFLVIVILMIMMIYVVTCIIYRVMKKFDLFHIKEIFNIEEAVSIDVKYDELYPFEKVEQQVNEKNKIEKYQEKIEIAVGKELIGREKFVESSYLYNDLINYKLVSNSSENARIDLGNGYYSLIVPKRNIAQCANRLIEFNEYLKNLNIDFLYVQTPYKISSTQKVSSIYRDYSNENLDNLLKTIKDKVDSIDLRENIKNNHLNHLKLFYKTDHHWLPETGLWATGEISKYLNEHYDMNLVTENVKFENYKIKKFEKMYLGSDGRYVTLKNAQPEDFSLVTPNFDTKLSVKIPDKGIDKTDTFENTLINWSNVKYKNYYENYTYDTYVYGNQPLIEIQNEFVSNHKKILLLRDSFSNVVEPFLALENEYVSVIDLREFDGSLKTYINQFKPDIVIALYSGDRAVELEGENVNEYISVMWDFE